MKTNLNIDTQGLREKILDLAIRGKLVEQDAGDEPASALLEKIKAEKAELVKEGKIKKSKKLPDITDDEKPFDIPDSWEWVRLGDIGDWGAGATPLKSNHEYYENGTIPWILTGDLNDGHISSANQFITEKALNETSVKIKPVGSVLIAMYGATIGKLGILDIEATTNQACCACVTFSGISKMYLFDYLMFMKPKFIESGVGGAQPNISRTKIVATLIPLPPLAEQHRIADKVSELFRQIEVIEKNVAEYQELEQAMRSKLLDLAMRGKLVEQDPNDEPASELLKQIQAKKAELVKEGKIKKDKKLPEITDDEKPFDIPDGWEWSRFGEISLENIGGGTPYKSNPNYWNGEIPWMTVKDVHEGDIYEFETKDSITDIGLTNSSSNLIPKGNLIVVMRMGVGRAIITKIDTAINQDLRGFIFSERVIEEYIVNIFSTLNFPTSGTTVKGIKLKDLLKTPIPLPPLEEQKRIVAKLEELFEQLDIINNNLVSAL